MKIILRSNVHQRVTPLECYLYGVSIQKVPQILRQKTGKIPQNPVFLLKSHRNNTNLTESHCLVTTKWSKVKLKIINGKMRNLEIQQFYGRVQVLLCTLKNNIGNSGAPV